MLVVELQDATARETAALLVHPAVLDVVDEELVDGLEVEPCHGGVDALDADGAGGQGNEEILLLLLQQIVQGQGLCVEEEHLVYVH